MCNAGFTGVGISAGAAAFSAVSNVAAGQAKSNYYNFLADQNKTNEGLAKTQGLIQETAINNQAAIQDKQLLSAQRTQNASGVAEAAAQGVAGSVTQQDVTTSNLSQEKLDELMIRYNADQAQSTVALNTQTQVLNQTEQEQGNRSAASNASAEGWASGVGSLVSGAGNVLGQYAAGVKEGAFSVPIVGNRANGQSVTGESTLNPMTGGYTPEGKNEAVASFKNTNTGMYLNKTESINRNIGSFSEILNNPQLLSEKNNPVIHMAYLE